MSRCKVNYLKWYNLNKERMVASSKKRYVKMRKLIQRWKVFKGCNHCGYNENACALDLDHISDNSTKPSHMRAVRYEWNKARIKKELSKCQVLCANCHRIKTQKDIQISVRSQISM